MRCAIYQRVSTTHQSLENQDCLYDFAKSKGWEVVATYREQVSGHDATRKEFGRLLHAAERKQFNVVLVFSISRFSRSLSHCINSINKLNDCGIGLFSMSENLSTLKTDPYSRLLLNLLASLSELETSILKERQKIGIERARDRGIRFGRPVKHFNTLEAEKMMRDEGYSLRKTARYFEVSPSTLKKRLDELQESRNIMCPDTTGVQESPACEYQTHQQLVAVGV
jgi:DNA invertase Pin-like site-specific DNA recombinase